jgi:hypothetical protein
MATHRHRPNFFDKAIAQENHVLKSESNRLSPRNYRYAFQEKELLAMRNLAD